MLKTRILSALVMAPPALLAVWFGGWWFAGLIAVTAAVMCWEWSGMVSGGFHSAGRFCAAAAALAALVAIPAPAMSLVIAAIAALVALVLAGGGGGSRRAWMAAGALYTILPAVALVWLRGADDAGRTTIVWLFLLVWATDIGAYAFGRAIGGPLLLPAVSPKKTWAGLLGGMLCSAVAGALVGWVAAPGQIVGLALTSAVLAVIAQVGDFAESWVKRRCGVKDSSAIIPGHGGVLDRVDGLLAVASAVAVAALAGGGSVLAWF